MPLPAIPLFLGALGAGGLLSRKSEASGSQPSGGVIGGLLADLYRESPFGGGYRDRRDRGLLEAQEEEEQLAVENAQQGLLSQLPPEAQPAL